MSPPFAKLLTAVDVSSFVGDRSYLDDLPAVRHVNASRDGSLTIWLEDGQGDDRDLDEDRPDRPPEVELHGQGAPCSAIVDHPRAQHVEMFFDGLGDPQAASRGWWHARIWLKAA